MINAGEYIRTKKGYIAKVIISEIYIEVDHTIDYKQDSGNFYSGQTLFDDESFIKSHSKNIIDLIEVGDYVNGERVTFITNSKIKEKKIITEYDTDFFEKYEKIETILTKEQYEQNCYKIGE